MVLPSAAQLGVTTELLAIAHDYTLWYNCERKKFANREIRVWHFVIENFVIENGYCDTQRGVCTKNVR
jgi:hypothetical protein